MENIKGQIYIHTNKITGKHYVGQTIASPAEARWKKGGDSYNKTTKFGRAIKKYGWESFEHTILPEIYESHEELDKAEIAKITELDSYKNGYNSTLGGNGSSGYQHRKETKEKISEALINLYKIQGNIEKLHTKAKRDFHHSNETKNKLKESLSKYYTEEKRKELSLKHTGKKHKEESIEKMKNHIFSEEHKRNLSEARKKRIISDETRKKLSDIRKGKHMDDITKDKIRKSNSGKSHSYDTKKKISETLKSHFSLK